MDEKCLADELKKDLATITGADPKNVEIQPLRAGNDVAITALAASPDNKTVAGVGVTTRDHGSTATVTYTEDGRTGSASVLQKKNGSMIAELAGEPVLSGEKAAPKATALAAKGQEALKKCLGKPESNI
jgi:hypothetical protein